MTHSRPQITVLEKLLKMQRELDQTNDAIERERDKIGTDEGADVAALRVLRDRQQRLKQWVGFLLGQVAQNPDRKVDASETSFEGTDSEEHMLSESGDMEFDDADSDDD